MDHISFINEDQQGSIWIGSLGNGMNRYDPATKQVTHFGFTMEGDKIISSKDTSGSFQDVNLGRFFSYGMDCYGFLLQTAIYITLTLINSHTLFQRAWLSFILLRWKKEYSLDGNNKRAWSKRT